MAILDSIYTVLQSIWQFLQFTVLSLSTLTQVVIDSIATPIDLSDLMTFPLLSSVIFITGFLMLIKLLLGR